MYSNNIYTTERPQLHKIHTLCSIQKQSLCQLVIKLSFKKVNQYTSDVNEKQCLSEKMVRASVAFFEAFQKMHWPGIEPRSTTWKAAMLTITPPMLC